jgi:hypothetical protein
VGDRYAAVWVVPRWIKSLRLTENWGRSLSPVRRHQPALLRSAVPGVVRGSAVVRAGRGVTANEGVAGEPAIAIAAMMLTSRTCQIGPCARHADDDVDLT